ncbi:MAG: nucleoside-diphosphate kinase [Nanoarchaeota archaeon]
MIEQTLVLIKPDGVVRCLSGEIIKRFERAGLKIIGLKMMWIDKDFAGKHYQDHKDKAFFQHLIDFITEAPVVAMVIEGVHAIENVRKMVGETDPSKSAPGTIRGDFAHLSMAWASKQKSGGKNLIHASVNNEDAQKEIALYFNKGEMHSYKTVHEEHTF